MKVENYVTLEFSSRSANEGFARTAAACFAAQLDPTLEEINDIKTAVSEAVTNAIVHAYPDRLGKIVMKLRFRAGNELEIVVKDWGVGIADVEQARTPEPRSAAAWALPLWRALWIPFGYAPPRGRGPRSPCGGRSPAAWDDERHGYRAGAAASCPGGEQPGL